MKHEVARTAPNTARSPAEAIQQLIHNGLSHCPHDTTRSAQRLPSTLYQRRVHFKWPVLVIMMTSFPAPSSPQTIRFVTRTWMEDSRNIYCTHSEWMSSAAFRSSHPLDHQLLIHCWTTVLQQIKFPNSRRYLIFRAVADNVCIDECFYRNQRITQ